MAAPWQPRLFDVQEKGGSELEGVGVRVAVPVASAEGETATLGEGGAEADTD